MREARVRIWKTRTTQNPKGYMAQVQETGHVPYYRHLEEREIPDYLFKLYREYDRLFVVRL